MITRLAPVAALVAFAISNGPLTYVAAQPQFSTRVEAVRVDALVTNNNRPVLGLRAEDFEVKDNGVPQSIELVSLESLPLNIVLALDLSISVEGERLDRLRRASHALLDSVKSNDRTGLVTFSQTVTLKCALSSDARCLRNALSIVKPGGQTSLVDATYAAMVLAESEPGRSLVMVFSDRFDTASWLTSARVVDTAKRSEVVVYGVMAAPGESRFLRDLSETTGGRLLRGDGTVDLGGLFVKILDEFRQRYILTYTPRGLTDAGWHELSVRVKRRGANVRARPGYFVDPR